MCDMTHYIHSYVEMNEPRAISQIYSCEQNQKKEDLYVAWIIDTRHDASVFEMTHSNVDTHETHAAACESMNPKVTPQIDFVFPQR